MKCFKLLTGSILLIICLAISGCQSRFTSDISEYGQYTGIFHFEKLSSFPDQDTVTNGTVVSYSYKYKETLIDDEQAVYLTCEFSEDNYRNEVSRLENSGADYAESLFDLPAYVFVYGVSDSYEYAVLDENNHTIYYTYIQYLHGIRSDIPFQYLPSSEDYVYCAYESI